MFDILADTLTDIALICYGLVAYLVALGFIWGYVAKHHS